MPSAKQIADVKAALAEVERQYAASEITRRFLDSQASGHPVPKTVASEHARLSYLLGLSKMNADAFIAETSKATFATIIAALGEHARDIAARGAPRSTPATPLSRQTPVRPPSARPPSKPKSAPASRRASRPRSSGKPSHPTVKVGFSYPYHNEAGRRTVSGRHASGRWIVEDSPTQTIGREVMTTDEVLKDVEFGRRGVEAKQRKQQSQARKGRSSATAKQRADLEEFLATLASPMAAKKAREALMVQQGFGGVFMPRWQAMEKLVGEGRQVTDDRKFGRILIAHDGSFYDQRSITKVAMDYADFLARRLSARGAHQDELQEMADLLSRFGYDPSDAARLRQEGMGPHELGHILTSTAAGGTGSLEHTHGLRKVSSVAAPHVLRITDEGALHALARLEGPDWYRDQERDKSKLRDPGSFWSNKAAYEALVQTKQELGPDAAGLIISDLIDDAGFIRGHAGDLYSVLPDGQIALIGQSASPTKRAAAAAYMLVA